MTASDVTDVSHRPNAAQLKMVGRAVDRIAELSSSLQALSLLIW
jgi:hypothetical protein